MVDLYFSWREVDRALDSLGFVYVKTFAGQRYYRGPRDIRFSIPEKERIPSAYLIDKCGSIDIQYRELVEKMHAGK